MKEPSFNESVLAHAEVLVSLKKIKVKSWQIDEISWLQSNDIFESTDQITYLLVLFYIKCDESG